MGHGRVHPEARMTTSHGDGDAPDTLEPLAVRAERFLKALRDGDDARAAHLAATLPPGAPVGLSCAAALADEARVLECLEQDAACLHEAVGGSEWRPLTYACVAIAYAQSDATRAARRRVVDHLLAWGAEPDRRVPWFPDDPNGPRLSALHFVTSHGDAALARQLLAAGAEPNDGESLFHAAESDRRDCLEVLLEYGADVNEATPPYGRTPLDFLLGHREGQPGTIPADRGLEWLLEHGARPDVPSGPLGETALHAAARNGRRTAIVATLVAHGAMVEATRRDGATPLGLALRHGHHETAAALRAHGASEAGVRDADRLLAACMNEAWEDARAILARTPTLADEVAADLAEAFARAAATGRIERMVGLHAIGCSPDGVANAGATALHWAAWHGQTESVRWLLAHGAAPDLRDATYGSSPLAWTCHGARFNREAVLAHHLAIADALLAAGATRAAAINRWGEGPEAFAPLPLAERLRDRSLVPEEAWASMLHARAERGAPGD